MHRLRTLGSSVGAVLAGCGAAGTQPHDMRAGQHHAAAETLESAAQEHAHRSDPGSGTVCGAGASQGSSPCWSTPSNQAAHEQEARRLHELAEKHRAAGHALVHPEVDACAGLSEADRDVSPVLHRADIASVTLLSESGDAGNTGARAGATIRFRPLEGLTLGWLGRAVRCHLARSAAMGHSVELGECPLAVRGTQAEVATTSNGLVVEIWAVDLASGAEILRRAHALQATPGSREE